jgi:hypothetical protein
MRPGRRRLGSGHHGEAARRRLPVDARAGEGARRGAARSVTASRRSLACSGGKKKAPGDRGGKNGARVFEGERERVFDRPKSTRSR